MPSDIRKPKENPPGGWPETAAPWRRWLAFLLGLVAIFLFVFGFIPWVSNTSAVQPLTRYVEESGIDAGALYYTEVEETGDAETFMRNSMNYPPHAQE